MVIFTESDEPKQFENISQGIKGFLKYLTKLDFKPDNTILGVESTGSYHLKLSMACVRPEPIPLTAYIGIDLRVYESGTSIKGKGYITKRGNKIFRTILFNATSVAVLYPNMFQRFFKKKRSEGKAY